MKRRARCCATDFAEGIRAPLRRFAIFDQRIPKTGDALQPVVPYKAIVHTLERPAAERRLASRPKEDLSCTITMQPRLAGKLTVAADQLHP